MKFKFNRSKYIKYHGFTFEPGPTCYRHITKNKNFKPKGETVVTLCVEPLNTNFRSEFHLSEPFRKKNDNISVN